MDTKFRQFILEHQDDDTDKLLLGKKKWPEIDVAAAVNCILSRRKMRDKVPQWYACEGLFYPNTLSAEQCSSTFTALQKASLCTPSSISSSISNSHAIDDCCEENRSNSHAIDDCWNIADLTGGLGVDSWAFAQNAKVLYNEMDPGIYAAAVHNFAELGVAERIICRNFELRPDNIDEILDGFAPDVIFLDPARRSSAGGKVFRLEDCSPNLLELAGPLLDRAPKIVAKLSPMADISLICKQLENCGVSVPRVYVVGASGECKELLVEIGKVSQADREIFVVEEGGTFRFTISEEKDATPSIVGKDEPFKGRILFEPGKTLMKAGAYNLLCRNGLKKLGRSTHLYVCDEIQAEIAALGKVFRILEAMPFDKRSLKAAAQSHPRCEVTARNLPLSSDELRKKMGVTSGSDTHIFGVKSDTQGNLLLITRR